jgi:hypothetical protein
MYLLTSKTTTAPTHAPLTKTGFASTTAVGIPVTIGIIARPSRITAADISFGAAIIISLISGVENGTGCFLE